MSVENGFFLLDSTNDVNITVWNNNSLRIIWKVVQIIELLNLIAFALEVEKITMSLLDREYGDLLN